MPLRRLLTFALAVSACGSTPPPCPSLWTPGPQSTTVTEADELLTLDAPAASPWPAGVSVTQSGLAGDFTLSVQVQAFTTTASDGELTTSVEADGGLPWLAGSIVGDRVQVAYQPATGSIQTMTQPVSTLLTTGAIAFSRHGPTTVVTVVGGGQTVAMTADVGTGPLDLAINAIRPSAGGDTNAQISNVTATDPGGSFKGDTFRCDSLGY